MSYLGSSSRECLMDVVEPVIACPIPVITATKKNTISEMPAKLSSGMEGATSINAQVNAVKICDKCFMRVSFDFSLNISRVRSISNKVKGGIYER
jgi:hypothetical protein